MPIRYSPPSGAPASFGASPFLRQALPLTPRLDTLDGGHSVGGSACEAMAPRRAAICAGLHALWNVTFGPDADLGAPPGAAFGTWDAVAAALEAVGAGAVGGGGGRGFEDATPAAAFSWAHDVALGPLAVSGTALGHRYLTVWAAHADVFGLPLRVDGLDVLDRVGTKIFAPKPDESRLRDRDERGTVVFKIRSIDFDGDGEF